MNKTTSLAEPTPPTPPKLQVQLPADLGQKVDSKGTAFKFDLAENQCKPGSACCP